MTKILWFDDELDNVVVEQEIIEDEFDNLGLSVDIQAVQSLDDCLQKLAHEAYEALILDLQINLGPNADAVQQTWVGAGVYAWLRLAGDVARVEELPRLVKEKLSKVNIEPKPQNKNIPIAIVSGVAKNEVVTFIHQLNLNSDSRPILRIIDKPVDEQKFTDFIRQVAEKCQSKRKNS